MNEKTDGQNAVSRAYHQLRQTEPPAEIDQLIRQSARKSLKDKSLTRKYFIPLSIAASVVLLSAVLINMMFFAPKHEQLVTGFSKQPMYMMQRSKPPAADVMISQMELLLQKNEINEASVLHQRFRSFYPQHTLSSGLTAQLQQHQIISPSAPAE